LTMTCVLVVAAYAWFLSWRTRRALIYGTSTRESALLRYERGHLIHRFLVFGAYVSSLLLFGWGRAAYWLWGAGEGHIWPESGGIPRPGAELVLLAPFFLSLLVSWAFFYDVDRTAYWTAHRILGIDPVSREWLDLNSLPHEAPAPFGSRLSYVVFQLRQKMGLVLILLSLLLVMKEARRQLRDAWPGWEIAINTIGILGVFVAMPWMVRLALGLRSMPPGPRKDRLLAVARRLRFRFSDILLWHTRGGMANAMVMGLLPWPRYVVFTDRLVEDFQDDELEAVFGHEVGHIKHRHMLYYLGFLSCSVLVLWISGERFEALVQQIPSLRSWLSPPLEQSHEFLRMLPPAALVLGYIFVVFGFLSRRCERQADVYGCRAVSCQRADCDGHSLESAGTQGDRGLCPTGIRTFVRALEKVARVNGISRDRPGFLQSWQHSTIARRVEFLDRVLADPAEEPRFQRRVTLVKWGLFALLGALLAIVLHYGSSPLEPEGVFSQHPAEQANHPPGVPTSP
jgi:Zn-dependent protease with chaperone function